MKTSSIVYGVFLAANFMACAGEFKIRPACEPPEVEDAEGKCQSAGAAGVGGTGGAGGQGAQSGGPSGGGGVAPTGTPVLQVPPRRVGLRRARALDVTIGLQQAVGVALSVTVDGLPAYMSAEPLTLPAGTTSGVLTMRATNEAPLGVPSQVRVRAAGAAQPAEANLEAWVMGEPGTLDESFGEKGLAVGSSIKDVAGVGVSATGELFVAGTHYNAPTTRVAVTKYLSSGTLDATFGEGGILSYAPRGSTFGSADGATARAIDVQPDGKIITSSIQQVLVDSGQTTEAASYRLLVSRHMPSGSLDATFGEGGAIALDDGKLAKGDSVFSPEDPPFVPFGVALLALGSVHYSESAGAIFALTPNAYDAQTHSRAFQLSSSGAPNKSFGAVGFAALAPTTCHPVAAAVTPEGGLVIAGSVKTPSDESQACVVRLASDGQPDESFGQNGVRLLPLPQTAGIAGEALLSVAVQSDGKTLVTGISEVFNGADRLLLARLLPDGSFDTSFGDGGRTSKIPANITPNQYSFHGLTVRLDAEGNPLLLVQEFVENNADRIFVMKYSAAGQLDESFGSSGAQRVHFAVEGGGDFGASAHSLVQLPDGQLVVLAIHEGTQRLARLWP